MLKFSVKRYLRYLYSGETSIACLLLLVEVSPIQQDWRDSTFLFGIISNIYTRRNRWYLKKQEKQKLQFCAFKILLLHDAVDFIEEMRISRIVAIAVLLSQVLIAVSLYYSQTKQIIVIDNSFIWIVLEIVNNSGFKHPHKPEFKHGTWMFVGTRLLCCLLRMLRHEVHLETRVTAHLYVIACGGTIRF